MANFSDKIAKAKQAGYSDAEIAAYLSQDQALAPKIEQARSAGYDDAAIVGYLASSGQQSNVPQPAKAKPAPQRSFMDDVTGFMANVNRGLYVGDEIAAAGQTVVDMARGQVKPQGPGITGALRGVAAGFRENMADQRAIEADYSAARPLPAALARGTGNALTVAVPAGQTANALAAGSRAANMARGATAAGLSAAGYAAADEGTIPERIEAASRAATNPLVLGLGAAAGALAPAAPKTSRSVLAEQADRFDQAGVRMPLAATGPGKAATAKAISENPIAGYRARRFLEEPLDDTAAAVDRVAGKYGTATSRELAGEAAQQGVRDFNRRFSERAGRLYDRAFSAIDDAQAAKVAAAEQQALLRPGAKVAPVIDPRATKGLLRDVNTRVNAAPLADIIDDPRMSRIAKALEEGGGDIRFSDLRALRTWVREAQKNETLRQGIDRATLQRLESTLTDDIQRNAMNLAGPKAARQLRQADNFYRIGSQRIETQLQDFLGKATPRSGESAYDAIITAASDKGGANAAKLLALKKSLTPEEWGDVAATTVTRLGKPAAGVADKGPFSVSTFVTNYEKLSPRGRALLFGSGDLRKELDNLVSVASALKDVERAANSSRSATAMQSIGTVAGLANPGTVAPTVTGLAAMTATGEALTNPAFVRWLVQNAKAARAGRQIQLSTLQALMARDPQLARIYREGLEALPRAAGATGVRQQPTVEVEIPSRPELGTGQAYGPAGQRALPQ